ncbi:MAG: sugar transferase [Acidimicrobiia bacterium]
MKRSTLAPSRRRLRIAVVDAEPISVSPAEFTAQGHTWLHRRASSERPGLVLKYAVDRVVALACLIVALPVMLVVALAVRLSSRGPILYHDARLGQYGREFQMLKFRTMTGSPDTDGEADGEWIARQAGRSATRVATTDRTTPVGRVLRRFALDELPQLFNVLRGDMSLIGPRPERAAVARIFMEGFDGYVERHRVKPGMTGFAQVQGLRGETSLRARIDCDNYYVDNWSVCLDLKVLLLTVPAMLRGPDAHR